ncbi:hypothetical protein CALVIDRAFT_576843 [Calocera viscosa TUFC12733]|uniref:Concanavalin A-like lectin/glucanase n=1 Tax=Calocera viscosa (strain TUFC12733) TaxID=1330018 RepID=A0A167M0Q6_CALVF|nr:hypothetical protein CALVIDRAFT_576843 [Calocera viscosa TUFC12733]
MRALSFVGICGLVASLGTSVYATPTPPLKRQANYVNQAGVIASTDAPDTFTQIVGAVTVPDVTIPSGGDPSQLYYAQTYIGLFDANFQYYLAAGFLCFAGSQTGCKVSYEYLPVVEPAGLTGFPISPGDELLFALTVVDNKTVTITFDNFSTDQSVGQPLFNPNVQSAPFTQAGWFFDTYSANDELFIDFGTILWQGSAAITANGDTVGPSEAQTSIPQQGFGQVTVTTSETTISFTDN